MRCSRRIRRSGRCWTFEISRVRPKRSRQKLKGATLKGVLEKILGAAGKATAKSVTLEQLTGIVQGSLKQIPPAAAEVMRGIKGFKAGEWKPKAKQPKGMYVGSKVHEKIAERYERQNPSDLVFSNSIPMSSIFKKGFDLDSTKLALSSKQLGLKPDILNVTKKHLYEIKPEKQIANAVIERDVYITVLETAGVPVERGPMNAPGANGVIEAPGGHALYYSPLPGVILYRVRKGDYDPAKVPLPVAGRLPVKDESAQRTPGPVGVPSPVLATEETSPVIAELERATGLTGLALLLYIIVSEGSRIAFPPRNLLPLP